MLTIRNVLWALSCNVCKIKKTIDTYFFKVLKSSMENTMLSSYLYFFGFRDWSWAVGFTFCKNSYFFLFCSSWTACSWCHPLGEQRGSHWKDNNNGLKQYAFSLTVWNYLQLFLQGATNCICLDSLRLSL